MRKSTGFLIVAIALVALAWLTGCERELSGANRAAVLAFSEAATDSMLAGLAANDYATFSRDFDPDLQELMPAADFPDWKQELDSKLGRYLSRQVDRVTRSDEFYVVFYQVRFEQDESVLLEVAFHAKKPHPIAHLGLGSDKLRWSSA